MTFSKKLNEIIINFGADPCSVAVAEQFLGTLEKISSQNVLSKTNLSEVRNMLCCTAHHRLEEPDLLPER